MTKESWGSVEGTAETKSIHSSPYFSLYRSLGGVAIRCNCDRAILDDFDLGDRLLVYGKLRTTRKGDLKSVSVESIRHLRGREELPQGENILGLTVGHDYPTGGERS